MRLIFWILGTALAAILLTCGFHVTARYRGRLDSRRWLRMLSSGTPPELIWAEEEHKIRKTLAEYPPELQDAMRPSVERWKSVKRRLFLRTCAKAGAR